MNLVDTIRFGLAGLLVYLALNGVPEEIKIFEPYNGPLTHINEAANAMETQDRQGLSEALVAASKMLDDKANLLKTTEDLQEFIKGTISFGYSSFSLKQYPNVAAEIQKELESSVGATVQTLTPELKEDVAKKLSELSRAIK